MCDVNMDMKVVSIFEERVFIKLLGINLFN